ncbi:thioredoxin family protein [uncultured Psychroserpens sp.]|uniref:thioredoxin family protein n=1 Tax=uncultured Psychroserpens sp. TaxID=255436 RepID=UPI0026333534|nr:thioredoxin family protein [uncultured Psychroserpens sp.]
MKLLLYLPFLISFSVFSQDWNTNLETAKSIAQENEQTIILVFQGSDWCAPCMKLDRAIFQSETFKSYAKSHFVMLKADFPRRKKNALSEKQQNHNKKLAEMYNKYGYFPHVVVLDGKGNVLGETGFKKTTPEAYIKLLESFKK